MRRSAIGLTGIISFLFITSTPAWPSEELAEYCGGVFVRTGDCPAAYCRLQCHDGTSLPNCTRSCRPKSCFEIEAGDCPVSAIKAEETPPADSPKVTVRSEGHGPCRLLEGCSGKKVCFDKADTMVPSCGALAYLGDEVPCCAGLVKKCGVEFFDGSCDMIGERSVYSVPVCLPCGNGICNQFENRCNCPEDCR